jgi:hypothetical protein
MKQVICRRTVSAALLCAALAAGTAVGAAVPKHAASITLTDRRPAAFFRVSRETVSDAPPVLHVLVPRVVNPAGTALLVEVYFTVEPAGGAAALPPRRISVGHFAFFPANRGSGYVMNTSTAFRELKSMSAANEEIRLWFELRRLHPEKPWTKVEVSIAPPEWKTTARQTGAKPQLPS